MREPCCGRCIHWQYRETLPVPPDMDPEEYGDCEVDPLHPRYPAYNAAPCESYQEPAR